MKYLIVGLGNMEEKYFSTRHNVGFQILDHFSDKHNITFSSKRYGNIAKIKLKGKTLSLLKPSTYVNLSGKAVNYWLQKEKMKLPNLLVIVDDIALPFGKLRLRIKGSSSGHNGLEHIEQTLGHQKYARLRIGIGNKFMQGQQISYVLGHWTEKDQKKLPKIFENAVNAIESFVLQGAERTMNYFNKKSVTLED